MYYGNDVGTYLQQLCACIQSQQNKIQQLESMIQQMSTDLQALKDKPSTTIEKIEYKFDQLKVETLEGTLNIGLNPTDPEPIENFEVIQKGQQVGKLEREYNGETYALALDQLNTYLSEECLNMLEAQEQRHSRKLNDEQRKMVIEDIRKQIDTRVQYYMKTANFHEGDPDSQADQITQRVKEEIAQSVDHFIKYLPVEVKGEQP
ncbi:spore gernimation protein GerPC [Metabacillus sp. KIGAM252]|uniref:Spore gernimation protein GerPC n=1 Tax=Metabacillus flavus TaxID=2823519 RepID=A0ABS5LCK4_9BACI|nr:spore germination protein GerPC [Metabacillus flavus]MBS2968303.1 spore gernimation protein GerPC [Metabacillus flavus]